jgi:hypothetical protein
MLTQNLVGKVFLGQYKRAGRNSTTMAVEVTAHVRLPDSRGTLIPYLFGTRVDSQAAGNVVLVRTNCFRAQTAVIEDAKKFEAIPLEGWYVTQPSEDNASFAFIEKVEKADEDWAKSLGGRPLADFVVKAA